MVRDHLNDKGLPYGNIKSIHDSEEEAQNDNMPDLDSPGEDIARQ